MLIYFRTDASAEIGIGHVMRCLTLAGALRERGCDCHFVCRAHPGHLAEVIRQRGHAVHVLTAGGMKGKTTGLDCGGPAHDEWLGTDWETDAAQCLDEIGDAAVDWLIVDHYALDARWEQRLRTKCRKIMVIDDLADRVHDCDLLLDQNLVAGREQRYQRKVPVSCGLMLGPDYALLQPAYSELHSRVAPREGPIGRILVYFGGADKDNLAGMAISAFLSLRRPDVALDVVTTPAAAHAESIRCQAKDHRLISLHSGLSSLALLMANTDLAIGAAGATSWERCCLGLPSLVITIAENQKPVAAELDRLGLIRWLGHKDEVGQADLEQALAAILEEGLPPAWSKRCSGVVDGRGVERVRGILMLDDRTSYRARSVTLADEATILQWANDPLVRKNAFNSNIIDSDTHRIWFRKKLHDSEDCRFYVVETCGGIPMGQVRFERTGETWEVHYGMASYCRGRGLGALFLNTALSCFTASMPGTEVLGRVKPENQASRKVFKALGFDELWATSGLTYRRKMD